MVLYIPFYSTQAKPDPGNWRSVPLLFGQCRTIVRYFLLNQTLMLTLGVQPDYPPRIWS